ncbi:hypothetical protein RyT2_03190 [Pseudolactococcus yaeyamensis]
MIWSQLKLKLWAVITRLKPCDERKTTMMWTIEKNERIVYDGFEGAKNKRLSKWSNNPKLLSSH